MAARVIDGRALADRIKRDVQQEVEALRRQGRAVRLDAILVGEPAAGRIYAHSQETLCHQAGIGYRLHALPAEVSQAEVSQGIQELNADPEVTGIMLHLPMPEGLDTPALQYAIDPYKDVEGVNPANLGLLFYGAPIMAPCTALAVLEMLKAAECQVRGKHVCVIGQGLIAGRPIALALLAQNATVTACCLDTPDLAAHTLHADVLIAAAGVPHLVQAHHVKAGAVVIDVGIHRVPGPAGPCGTGFPAGQPWTGPGPPGARGRPRMVGDVDFEAVREVASIITPVPGGVGPVTVAILLRSTVEAAWKQRGRPHGDLRLSRGSE